MISNIKPPSASTSKPRPITKTATSDKKRLNLARVFRLDFDLLSVCLFNIIISQIYFNCF